MNYYLECFKKYATFAGRARRKEYWMFVLFNMIAMVICMIIDALLTAGILTILYSLAVIIPSISVCVRRLLTQAARAAGGGFLSYRRLAVSGCSC